jgi:cytidine deaminase
MDASELIAAARRVAGEFRPSPHVAAGGVAAALLADSGRVYTGVCIDTGSSLGFCAEHAAVAELLKARESRVRLVVAVTGEGTVLPPCGRCRELLWQLDARNAATGVVLAPDRVVPLAELLPHPSFPQDPGV